MSNLVPDDWSRSKLGDLIGVQGGNAFKSEFFRESGIPIIRISNIKKDGSVNLKDAVYFDEDSSLTRFKAIKGDVLIAMSGATTGKVGRYNSDGFAYINQRVGRFFLKDDNGCSIDFIHQITSEDEFTNSILIDAVGGAQPNISNQQIESISIHLPPLSEQQKIAQILTSVDEVIEKTQAQIDKLKDLKTAMMQELLTKGVCDENGKRHVEFKDSPVGRIPVGWDYRKLGALVTFSQGIQADLKLQKNAPFYGSAPFLRIENYTQNSQDLRHIDKSLGRNKYVYKNDVVLVRYGATAGFVGRGAEGILANNLFQVKPDENILSRDYLYLILLVSFGKFQLMMTGGAMPALNFTMVSDLGLVLPPLQEQRKITKAVFAVQTLIDEVSIKLKSQNSLKKALMQDLLTGKVRVNTAQTNPALTAG